MAANVPASAAKEIGLDMRASRNRRSRHAIAGPRRLPLAALLCLACAGATPPPLAPPAGAPLTPGALRVRLVFGAAADLDLYVTGPAQETVYFANDTSRDGGALEADRRCDDPAPRVETVVFEDAAPALYRVGVDFMVRCNGADEAPYALVVEAPGREAVTRNGVARFGAFEPVALELRVAEPAP
jgi:hypothetical protein